MISTVESEFGFQAGLDVSPAALRTARSLGEDSMNAIVKVARESLVNAAKHARPCEVRVSLTGAGHNRVCVAIVDNGPGITSNGDGRHGMASMRAAVEERGGTLSVTSPPAGGTRVEATLPVLAAVDAGAHATTPLPAPSQLAI
jgi:signal transduction histidine kinase